MLEGWIHFCAMLLTTRRLTLDIPAHLTDLNLVIGRANLLRHFLLCLLRGV